MAILSNYTRPTISPIRPPITQPKMDLDPKKYKKGMKKRRKLANTYKKAQIKASGLNYGQAKKKKLPSYVSRVKKSWENNKTIDVT